MSKTVLIALLGNQDLQLRKSAKISLESRDWFTRNNDGDDWIIDKSLKQGPTFLSISEQIKNQYEDYKNDLCFPLVQPILDEHLKQVDKIIFCTSDQSSKHPQDCVHIAHTIAQHYEKNNYVCEQQLFTCKPIDFGALVIFFTNVFEQIEADAEVYIATSGGTPAMRSAIHFAGLFRGYTYFSVRAHAKAKARVSKETFERQEALVLRSIVLKMLDVYDYEGISKLPIPAQVKELCGEAIDRYNFTSLTNSSSSTYDIQAKIGLAALYENLELCYKQGRYADVAGRIFRIEEAIGHLLYYQILQEENLLVNECAHLQRKNGQTKNLENYTINYREILNDKKSNAKLLSKGFSNLFHKNRFNNDEVKDVIMFPGKSFWYYFCRSLKKYPKITSFFEPINNGYLDKDNNPLVELRNKSILGHGYQGVSKQEVDNLVGGFDKFLEGLKQLFINELSIPINEEFEQINKKILAIIDK